MKENQRKYINLQLSAPQTPPATRLGKAHIRGLEKLGAVIMPENTDFPPFSAVDAEKYINRMVDYMYEDDRKAILMLLRIFAITPHFIIRWLMYLVESGAKWKGMSGAPFRMLQIGLKGLIFTIYYSDMTPDQIIHAKIGYDARIVM